MWLCHFPENPCKKIDGPIQNISKSYKFKLMFHSRISLRELELDYPDGLTALTCSFVTGLSDPKSNNQLWEMNATKWVVIRWFPFVTSKFYLANIVIHG